MKKTIVALVFLLSMVSANAFTFMYYGTLMGTVCRDGNFYTTYPRSMAQPVGTVCPVRDGYGNVMGYGVVTTE